VTEHVVSVVSRTREEILVRGTLPANARIATGTLDRLSDGQRVQTQ